jgi:hypothetical protein
LEAGGGSFGNVTDRFVRAAVQRARSRRVVIPPDGQDALGEFASRAASELANRRLLDDDDAVNRAEESIVRIVDALPTGGLERRGAGARGPTFADEAVVRQVVAGLCPGLWPIC